MVTNLSAADFTLTEDSRPQVIRASPAKQLPFRVGLSSIPAAGLLGHGNERKAAASLLTLCCPPTQERQAGRPGFSHSLDQEVELLEDFTTPRQLHHELGRDGPLPRAQRHARA